MIVKICEKCGELNLMPYGTGKNNEAVCRSCWSSLPESGIVKPMVGHREWECDSGNYSIAPLKLND